MTAVIDVLRERGYPQVDEASLVRALEDLLPASTDPTELPAADAQYMAAHSGLEITGTSLAGAVERLAARRIAQAAQTLDTESVARLLGLHRTRVQHLLEDGALYAYRDGRRNRFPAWQFTADARPLPGLRRVLAALGPVHHSVVTGFIGTPQPELDRGEGPVSAHDWLASGGDPIAVADIAGGVHQPW